MAKKKNVDFSNKTVLMMLVAVIVVTVGSMLFYVTALDTGTDTVGSASSAEGKVSITIDAPPVEKDVSSAVGYATITIERPPSREGG